MSDVSQPAAPGATATKDRKPIVLAVLLVILAAVALYSFWPSASGPASPSNSTRAQRKQAAGETKPGELDVRLEALKQPPAGEGDSKRNPFRFYVPPPPPPPPPPRIPQPGDKDYIPPPRVPKPGDPDYVPPPPPPPPPIPLRFTGIAEAPGKKVAIFCDSRGLPVHAKEGEVILGQYRLVKINVESVTMEYLDGKGRQAVPMRGCMG